MNIFGSTRAKQYRLHRWIATIIGVFVLWQAFSGSVWVLPFPSPAQRLRPRPQPIELDSINISPKMAVQNLENYLNEELKIQSVQIKSIKNLTFYEISHKRGMVHFVDVKTGEVMEMTEKLAVVLASAQFPKKVPPTKQISKIEKHDLIYRAGPLPVYRIIFDHRHGFVSHVSAIDGTVSHSDQYNRIRDIIVGLHDLSLLTLLWQHPWFYRITLCILAVVTTGAAITGYYLAVSRIRKKPKFNQKAIG